MPDIDNTSHTILVIDDEPSIQKSLKSILSSEGFNVYGDTSPEKCIEYFKNNPVDLVMLDIWMPEKDGYEVLSELKKLNQNCPVLVMSGHANLSSNFKIAKMGADGFLEKPFNTETLKFTLTELLSPRESTKPKHAVAKKRLKILVDEDIPQKTISKNSVLKGRGLHTGENSGIILCPLPPDSGIFFEDISTGRRIQASVENVASTSYATNLTFQDITISVVEHLLAACHIYGITNLLIKVNKEIPILDGSGIDFCDFFEANGITLQEKNRKAIKLKEKYTYVDPEDETKKISIEPSDDFEIDYTFDLPQFGDQIYKGVFGEEVKIEKFKSEIAPARTFGFLNELETVQAHGLGRGGDMSNFLLIDDDKVVNKDLRYPDEFARHKVLDIMGDFYLLGGIVKAKVTGFKTGHRHNIGLLKKVLESES